MTAPEMPAELAELLARHMSSMDHVALLLASHETAAVPASMEALAQQARIQPAVAERVLRDLVAARLLRREGELYHYAPAAESREGVEALAEMNRTKPVTLIRAVYDRPARAAQSFADAFRLRKPGE